MNREVLKISSNTDVKKLSGAIAGIIRRDEDVELQAIGPKAVSQAVKAVAIAKGYLAPEGIEIIINPAFINVVVGDGDAKSAISMMVEKR